MNALNPNFDSSASPIDLAWAITRSLPANWHTPVTGRTDDDPIYADDAPVYDGELDGMGNPLDGGPLVEPVEAEPETAQEAPAPSCYGEFVIGRASIGKVMAALVRVVEKRNTIPVLSHVLLHASGGVLTAITTDLDCEIAALVECSPNDEFIATVNAHTLDSILKKAAASDEVGFRVDRDGEAVSIFWGELRYRLPTISPDDFPALPAGELPHRFSLPGQEFRGMLESTARAVSKEETRYYLRGVYLHATAPSGRFVGEGETTTWVPNNHRELRAVATDGHRLYRADMTMPDGANDMPGVIVPAHVVGLLLALTKGKGACPDAFAVAVSESKIRVSFGDLQITSKLVDGTFPEYQRVIPTGNDRMATFDAGKFVSALDSVALIASEKGRAVKFTVEDGRLGLTVNNPDAGSASMNLPCTFQKGDAPADMLEIGFNTGYLATMMKDLADDGGEIAAAFGDCGSPAIFRSGRENFLAVLMPMRV